MCQLLAASLSGQTCWRPHTYHSFPVPIDHLCVNEFDCCLYPNRWVHQITGCLHSHLSAVKLVFLWFDFLGCLNSYRSSLRSCLLVELSLASFPFFLIINCKFLLQFGLAPLAPCRVEQGSRMLMRQFPQTLVSCIHLWYYLQMISKYSLVLAVSIRQARFLKALHVLCWNPFGSECSKPQHQFQCLEIHCHLGTIRRRTCGDPAETA